MVFANVLEIIIDDELSDQKLLTCPKNDNFSEFFIRAKKASHMTTKK